MEDWAIIDARLEDAAEVAALYAHHVLNGSASWEFEPPDADEMRERIAGVLEAGWPWLIVRESGGALAGYAYAGQFKSRCGYLTTCEDSIYLRHDLLGRGLGKRLLAELIARCEALGFRQMIAGMSGSEPGSRALHASAGFTEVARLPAVGRKFGQWLDLVYMQRALGPGSTAPPDRETA